MKRRKFLTVLGLASPGTVYGIHRKVTIGSSAWGLSMLSVFAQDELNLTYQVGFIPPQRCWSGRTLSVKLLPPEGYGSSTIISISPQALPAGPLRYDQASRTLTYTPATDDRTEFDVIVRARDGAKQTQQVFRILPLSHLQPEALVISSQLPPPDPTSRRYLVISRVRSDKSVWFNAQQQRPLRIDISGPTVIFDHERDENGLVKEFVGKRDIESLSIYADTVIVRGPLNMPQTNVTIYAKTLRFEDIPTSNRFGKIDTTPISEWDEIGELSKDGERGHDAGQISLNISVFEVPLGANVRFIAHGGNGQKGGKGKNGDNGTPLTNLGDVQLTGGGGRITGVVYHYHDFPAFQRHDGSKSWPGAGQQAKAAGRPGHGGNGGKIKSLIHTVGPYIGDLGPGQPGQLGDFHKGGDPGTPSPAYWVRSFCSPRCSVTLTEVIGGPHTAGRGADAPAPGPNPNHPDAIAGSFEVISGSSEISWLHHYALQALLTQAKDALLGGDFATPVKILQPYRDSLSANPKTLLASPELSKLKLEVDSLLHRVSNNLDYFGNPAGWTPMLSLAVSLAFFEQEIEGAIRGLYLTYWIKDQATRQARVLEALSNLRSHLEDDTRNARSGFARTNERVAFLRTQAVNIANEISVIQGLLKQREQDLKQTAENNVAERHKIPFWQQALRTMGTICSVVPVFQPALAGIGQGLNLIVDVGSTGDWTAIERLPTIADSFTKERLAESRQQLQTRIDGLDPSNAANAREYAKSILSLGRELSKVIEQLQLTNNKTQVAQSEVDAELRRLETEDSQFKDIVSRIVMLNGQKESFAVELAAAVQEVTDLAARISNNLLAIDSTVRQLDAQQGLVEPETLRYIDALERRTFDRLLRYHYYVAKAYEYRLARKYQGDLRLESLLRKIQELLATTIPAGPNPNPAPATANGLLNPEQFRFLAEIYRDSLAQVVADLVTHFNARPRGQTKSVAFSLTEGQVAALNRGETININPVLEPGMLELGEEDQRINSVKAVQLTARITRQPTPATANVSLIVEHSDPSLVFNDGQFYAFRHTREGTTRPAFVWETTRDLIAGSVPQLAGPNIEDVTLLRFLLERRNLPTNDLMLYTQPSAWSNLKVRRKVTAPGGEITIDSVRLEITYGHSWAPPNQAVLVVHTSQDLTPHIICTKDQNGRSDGRGRFSRVYGRGTMVTLEAPPRFGTKLFSEWRDLNAPGNVLGTPGDPVLKMPMNMHNRIIAVYRDQA